MFETAFNNFEVPSGVVCWTFKGNPNVSVLESLRLVLPLQICSVRCSEKGLHELLHLLTSPTQSDGLIKLKHLTQPYCHVYLCACVVNASCPTYLYTPRGQWLCLCPLRLLHPCYLLQCATNVCKLMLLNE